MSRGLSTANAAAIEAERVNIALFAELEFTGGDVLAWTGAGNITTLGRTFAGVGRFGGVGVVDETGDLRPYRINFELGGIDSALISRVLNEGWRFRDARLWVGFFNEAWTALVAEPALRFAGRMSAMTIVESGAVARITVQAETRTVEIDREEEARLSDADQQARFPGDVGDEYGAVTAERPIYWGGPGPVGVPEY